MSDEAAESDSDKVPITQEDLDRFHTNARAALDRRGGAAMWEESLGGLQTAAFGLLPIAGMLWWGWSAAEMFLFMLVGLWVGILCDSAKVMLLRKRAQAFAAAEYDDWHVWVVVGALRDGSRKAHASHINAKWDPLGGVFVDFAMGGVSTVLIVTMLVREAGLRFETFESRYLLSLLVGLSLMRVLETVWEVFHHRAADAAGNARQSTHGDRPVKAMVGLRGVGLFLLVFLTVFVADEENGLGAEEASAWWAMLVVNSLVVLYGLLNLTSPLWLMRETRWLRDYLANRAATES